MHVQVSIVCLQKTGCVGHSLVLHYNSSAGSGRHCCGKEGERERPFVLTLLQLRNIQVISDMSKTQQQAASSTGTPPERTNRGIVKLISVLVSVLVAMLVRLVSV